MPRQARKQPPSLQQAAIRRALATRTRQARARGTAYLPHDPNTWREVEDLQPTVTKLLAAGGWYAVHIRVQGFRFMFGDNPAGILQTVPPRAAYGWPDWLCYHPRQPGVLVLELKAQHGVVSPDQRTWLHRMAHLPGHEVAVVRPYHACYPKANPTLHRRLVLHQACPPSCRGVAPACTGWCTALVRPNVA